MNHDLQARIEAAARECATNINGHIMDNDWIKREFIELDTLTITAALTSLANQIIAEKDAEAAAFRHDLETSEGLYACDNAEGQSLFVLSHPSLKHSTAGRDTLAELASLRARVRGLTDELLAWVGSELPVDTAAEIRARLLLDKETK